MRQPITFAATGETFIINSLPRDALSSSDNRAEKSFDLCKTSDSSTLPRQPWRKKRQNISVVELYVYGKLTETYGINELRGVREGFLIITYGIVTPTYPFTFQQLFSA